MPGRTKCHALRNLSGIGMARVIGAHELTNIQERRRINQFACPWIDDGQIETLFPLMLGRCLTPKADRIAPSWQNAKSVLLLLYDLR